jgi:heptosyltransferase-2
VTRLPARLLVDLPNWLGDVVHSAPALLALTAANRGGGTTVLLPPAYAGLVAGLGVSALERPRRAAFGWARRELAGKFDVAVTTRHSTRAKLLIAGSSARLALASAGRGAGLLGLSAFHVDRSKHQRHDFDGALRALTLPAVADGPVRLALDGVAPLGPRIRRALVGSSRPLVAILPATRALSPKRYPAGAYAAVGRELRERGIATLVVVGPGEQALGRNVAAVAGAALAPEGWELAETAALLAACDAAIGNDSGLTHLAAVVGCPSVALFGPTNPNRTAPVGWARVLQADRDGTWPAPATVVDAAMELLASTAAAARGERGLSGGACTIQ